MGSGPQPIPVRCPSCLGACVATGCPMTLPAAAFRYPRRCRGLLYCAPQERGSKPGPPQCGVVCFCRGERPLALLPRDWLQGYRLYNCDPRPHVIPTIPHQCHFGHPPSVISSAARNLGPKTKISQSPPLTFVRGRLLRNDKGVDSVANKEGGSHHTFAHPRRCRGLLYDAPQERGSKPRSPGCGRNGFVGASSRSPFYPGIGCTAPDSLCWFPKINGNSIVVRLIDFYELRLPRRLRLLAMTMLSCVSLRAKRRNLVTSWENDYIPSPGLRPPSPAGRGLG